MSRSLKQFNKWFSKEGSIIPVPGDAGYEGYVERRTSWKAALETVLGASQCSGDSVDVFWDAIGKRWMPVGCDVRDVIREELKE